MNAVRHWKHGVWIALCLSMACQPLPTTEQEAAENLRDGLDQIQNDPGAQELLAQLDALGCGVTLSEETAGETSSSTTGTSYWISGKSFCFDGSPLQMAGASFRIQTGQGVTFAAGYWVPIDEVGEELSASEFVGLVTDESGSIVREESYPLWADRLVPQLQVAFKSTAAPANGETSESASLVASAAPSGGSVGDDQVPTESETCRQCQAKLATAQGVVAGFCTLEVNPCTLRELSGYSLDILKENEKHVSLTCSGSGAISCPPYAMDDPDSKIRVNVPNQDDFNTACAASGNCSSGPDCDPGALTGQPGADGSGWENATCVGKTFSIPTGEVDEDGYAICDKLPADLCQRDGEGVLRCCTADGQCLCGDNQYCDGGVCGP